MGLFARIAWAYLPCHADREGRMADKPFILKLEILPTDEVDMDLVLGELAARRHIVRYQGSDGRRYIQIRNFHRYQNPHKNEKDSLIPPPPSDLVLPIREHSGNYASEPSNGGSAPSDPDPSPGQKTPPARDPVAGATRDLKTIVIEAPPILDLPQLMADTKAEVFNTPAWNRIQVNPKLAAEKSMQAAEMRATKPEALASMLAFWRAVKSGEHRRAKECAKDGPFAFGCWFSQFQGDLEAARGIAPKIASDPKSRGSPARDPTLDAAIAATGGQPWIPT